MGGPDELFDVVDPDDRGVAILRRAEVHAAGLRHRAVSVLLFGRDGRLLLQKRALTKDEHPGTWTVSASGHVEAGESYADTAPREVAEELGIMPPPLVRVGKLAACADTGNEFTVLFVGRHDGPFVLETGEVSETMWVSAAELRDRLTFAAGTLSPPFRLIAARLLAGGGDDLWSASLTAFLPAPAAAVVRFDAIVEGGTLMTPSGRVRADLGVSGGKIIAIGELGAAVSESRIRARGLHVLPGAIDTQVHFREPGLTHKEDIGSGSAGALLGGVTAFMEMPNTKPSTTTAELLAWKVARANETSHVDFAFFVGATPDNVGSLSALECAPGAAGVKVFMGSSTGSLLVDDPEVLAEVLRNGRRRVAVHAEDEARLVERKSLTTGASAHAHPVWRDGTTAALAVERLLGLASAIGRPVHVLHVTSADELPILARYKHVATCEVTPQHLTLAAPDCYNRLGTFAQMNPPIRSEAHRDALWRAIRSGLVDVIGSDHAPHTAEEKQRPYPESPSGMPGVQTLLPLMLHHARSGLTTLERVVDLVSAGPARVYGIAGKGRIAEGFDADLALVDLERQHTFSAAEMATRCGWTPFDGVTITGWPVMTLLRGLVAMRDGQLTGTAAGRVLSFNR